MDAPTQPLPTSVSSGGDKPKSFRSTRAEKRRAAKKKKTLQREKQWKAINGSSHFATNSPRDVDNMIVALLKIREQVGHSKAKDDNSLEKRITRDVNVQKKDKKKKELSAHKLEKLRKRRELRAERKKAWLVQKAASKDTQTKVVEDSASVSVSAPAPGAAPSSTTTPTPALSDSDEINFDEL